MDAMTRTGAGLLRRLRNVTHFSWKKDVRGVKLFGWHFYMTRCVMRRKTSRMFDKTHGKSKRRRIFNALWERSGGRCEVCGCELIRDGARNGREADGDRFAQCHHVIPLSMGVPGMMDNLGNLQMVCCSCHARIHKNPLMYAGMIEAKMRELGIGCALATDVASTGADGGEGAEDGGEDARNGGGGREWGSCPAGGNY